MDAKFIEERRNMLEKFCVQMAALPHLYYSDEFKIFLRQTNVDVEKVKKNWSKDIDLNRL